MPKSLSMQIPTSLFKKVDGIKRFRKATLISSGGPVPTASPGPPSKLRASTPRSLNTVSAAINLLDYCSMK